MNYRVVNLMACVDDGQVSLFDKDGICITSFTVDRLGICEAVDAMWARWCGEQHSKQAWALAMQKRPQDPWSAWAQAVLSGNKRGRWRFGKKTVGRLEPVESWDERIRRMTQHGRKKRDEWRSGEWYRWSVSVSHNNKLRAASAHWREVNSQGDQVAS